MPQYCPLCGCASFHLSGARLVCDLCGHAIEDPQQQQQNLQFARTYDLAQRHIAAGNWKLATDMLTPLLSQRPDDITIHKALLRAATEDYSDLEMKDETRRASAANTWDKLSRLGGLDTDAISFSRKRAQKKRDDLSKQMNKVLTMLTKAAICLIMAGISMLVNVYYCLAFIMAAIIMFIKLSDEMPVKTYRQLKKPSPNPRENPFR